MYTLLSGRIQKRKNEFNLYYTVRNGIYTEFYTGPTEFQPILDGSVYAV